MIVPSVVRLSIPPGYAVPFVFSLILIISRPILAGDPSPPGTARIVLNDGDLPTSPTLKTAGNPKTAPESPAKAKREPPPSEQMSLASYLEGKLGKKFHRRKEWAGTSQAFQPIKHAPKVWAPIGDVKYLTIHHATGIPREHPAQMIRRIFTGHTSPGGRLDAADIGYHFFVDRDGEVWEARDAAMQGTHVGSKPPGLNNHGNLGICGLGSFGIEKPPRDMTNGIFKLSMLISDYYGRPLTVRGHKQWVGVNRFKPRGGETCPGNLEPVVDRIASAMAARDQPEMKPNPSGPVAKASSTADAREKKSPPLKLKARSGTKPAPVVGGH